MSANRRGSKIPSMGVTTEHGGSSEQEKVRVPEAEVPQRDREGADPVRNTARCIGLQGGHRVRSGRDQTRPVHHQERHRAAGNYGTLVRAGNRSAGNKPTK